MENKINIEFLINYKKENPKATIRQTSELFKCSKSLIEKAFK